MSLHPFGPRLTVVDPPADDQRPSRLIVPETARSVPRGIVLETSEGVGLEPGCLVYYECGCHGCAREVDGVKVISAECVIAWEDA